MTDRPGGTYTFLFGDVEGSTALVRELGDEHASVLAGLRSILEASAERNGGRLFGSEGDAFFLVFDDAPAALRAAGESQEAIDGEAWPRGLPVRMRMGMHSGAARPVGDDFVGLSLHETARIMAAGHGGQVLLSSSTRELTRDSLPPGAALRDLGEHRLKDLPSPMRIHQLDLPGRTTAFAPLRTLEAVGAHLPTQVTSFVGRADVQRATALLERSRVLTLTGPGGTGKTRLSLQVAAEVADLYADGTWFVPLDGVTDPALVASEVAAALGLAAGADAPLDRVIRHLADRHALLVLDNMEQIVDAAPDVSALVRRCPGVAVLVTSRIPLRIAGEQEYPVPPLRLPDERAATAATAAASDAVRLFVERAMAVRPDFMLEDANAHAVTDIVRRLDGLPLAIELAAARLRTLPVEALRTRLADRLGLLTGGARDLPARQQTLRGAIAWSYDILDEPDRRLFARFAVFTGGADLREVEAVCGPADDLGRDVLDGLTSLVEQSLLRSVDPVSDEPRFDMLATIREYAWERLEDSGESDAIILRHAAAYVALAEVCMPHLTGPEGRAWNDRLEAEHDNIRAALDRLEKRDEAGLAMRLVTAAWRFWQVRGHLAEGEERIHRVLALPSAEAQPADLRSRTEGAAGSVAYWRARVASAHRHYTEALRLARECGDLRLLAESLYNAGFGPSETAFTQKQRYLAGRPFFEESLALYRELDDRPGIASALWALSISAGTAGDLAAAEHIVRESLTIARELGDPFRVAWATHMLGIALLIGGRHEEAEQAFHEALAAFKEADDRGGVALLLMDHAMLAVDREETGQAWRLVGAADRIREESGSDIITDVIEYGGLRYRTEPQDDIERAAFAAGREMGLDEAVAFALGDEATEGDEPPPG